MNLLTIPSNDQTRVPKLNPDLAKKAHDPEIHIRGGATHGERLA
jgi:hypothetical protein